MLRERAPIMSLGVGAGLRFLASSLCRFGQPVTEATGFEAKTIHRLLEVSTP